MERGLSVHAGHQLFSAEMRLLDGILPINATVLSKMK